MQSQLLINGQLVDGKGERLAVYNPATGEVVLEIPEATAEQVNEAVEAADAAFDQWGQTSPKERAEALLKLADVIEEHAEPSQSWNPLTAGSPITAC